MLRALFLATLFVVSSGAPSGQATTGLLHIKVVLIDAEMKATPVPHHVLLISDNPASAPPRQIVTARDGTADVKLRPGSYTVESDRPVALNGKAFQWTQMVNIVAGRDAVLELTTDNADVVTVPAGSPTSAAPLEADPTFLLPQWQDSVVAVWTPTAHASGFVIDANGLIATNQQVIGTAAIVEVQLTREVKVAARVLAVDAARDVAVLWIDPKAAASVRPVPLGCEQAVKLPVVDGQELFAIGAAFREEKRMTSGIVSRVEPHSISAEFQLAPGSAGGPVFTAGGGVVGMTSIVNGKDRSSRWDSRVIRTDDACAVVASAGKKMKDAAVPDGTHLPVEPMQPFPMQDLKDAAERRTGSVSPYQMASSDFDVAFITPVLTYAAEHRSEPASGRGRATDPRAPAVEPAGIRALRDFGDWAEYVGDFPPVLLVRATPRLVEGFWTTVARGAARTQGVSLPPIKRFKPGFSRMRAFCGEAEVAPIHPFKLEQRVSEGEAIYEGLYAFDPGALGPQCGTAKLVLYSEKEPEKGDVRIIDPKVLQQIWQDFESYRAIKP